MSDTTPMECHAALGPIAWTHDGMRAETQDGYQARIVMAQVGEPWLVEFSEPKDASGLMQCWGVHCPDLRAARVVVADLIGEFRDMATARQELANFLWGIMLAVQKQTPQTWNGNCEAAS